MTPEDVVERVIAHRKAHGFRRGTTVTVSTDVYDALPNVHLFTSSQPFAHVLGCDWYHDPELPAETVKVEAQ